MPRVLKKKKIFGVQHCLLWSKTFRAEWIYIFFNILKKIDTAEDFQADVRKTRYLWIHQAAWRSLYWCVPSGKESWKKLLPTVSSVINSPVVVYIQWACSFQLSFPAKCISLCAYHIKICSRIKPDVPAANLPAN